MEVRNRLGALLTCLTALPCMAQAPGSVTYPRWTYLGNALASDVSWGSRTEGSTHSFVAATVTGVHTFGPKGGSEGVHLIPRWALQFTVGAARPDSGATVPTAGLSLHAVPGDGFIPLFVGVGLSGDRGGTRITAPVGLAIPLLGCANRAFLINSWASVRGQLLAAPGRQDTRFLPAAGVGLYLELRSGLGLRLAGDVLFDKWRGTPGSAETVASIGLFFSTKSLVRTAPPVGTDWWLF